MAKFTYVEMKCELETKHYEDDLPFDGATVLPMQGLHPGDLFDCYTRAFRHGDAQFYRHQSEEERQRYYNQELGFPEVLEHPGSFVYQLQEQIIGFSLVMSYLEENFHISCMCLLPEFQGRGLGKAMLNRIKNIGLEHGCRSLTLGTEPGMKAFQLYHTHGFEVTAEHQVEM
jgi:ribosomal protein S18 acetylase RimI-like enzyme